jgi:dTDP-glucose 4,6-dehydratase
MKFLITGGAGFIGSNFLLGFANRHTEYEIINVDKLTYAANPLYLKPLANQSRYTFIQADIANKEAMELIFETHRPDVVIHFAAESHVDRSINDASPFIISNVLGTQILLDLAKHYKIQKFVHVSTDEVYGSIEEGFFTEESPLSPNSPYSASKAASDMLVRSYVQTHQLPAVISRCSNNFGPHQYPEKLIPVLIKKALTGQKLPIYGDGQNIRDWLYVEDHCKAIELICQKGTIGEVYNVGTHNEKSNIEIAEFILKHLGLSTNQIEFVQDRPGHDRRYAIDSSKIQNELGWQAECVFKDYMEQTIEWYKEQIEVNAL